MHKYRDKNGYYIGGYVSCSIDSNKENIISIDDLGIAIGKHENKYGSFYYDIEYFYKCPLCGIPSSVNPCFLRNFEKLYLIKKYLIENYNKCNIGTLNLLQDKINDINNLDANKKM